MTLLEEHLDRIAAIIARYGRTRRGCAMVRRYLASLEA